MMVTDLNMTSIDITYTSISSRSVVAFFDREKHAELSSCGFGKWSDKHSGYLLTSKKALTDFKSLVLTVTPTPTPTPTTTIPPPISRRFRRARSHGDMTRDIEKLVVGDDNASIIDHYKQYKKTPTDFAKTMFEHSDVELSESSDDGSYDSSSSEDYPKQSPRRSKMLDDGTYDKLSTLRKRFDMMSS